MENNCEEFHLLPVVVVTNADEDDESSKPHRDLTASEIDLMRAIKEKDLQKVKCIISGNVDEINFNESLPQTTPLCKAAALGCTDICELFLGLDNHRVDIDQPNSCGETPLLLAIKNCQLDTAKLLVAMGGDVNKPEPAGTIATPLFNAVWKGRSDLVQLLVQNGCDVNRGSSRNSPLFMAARLGCVHIAKILLEANCDKDWQNRFGVTALYEAVFRGNASVVSVLLDAGCDPNLKDKYELSPVHVLAQDYSIQASPDNINILNMLLNHRTVRCTVDQPDGTGDLAGDLAVRKNKPWVLGPLLHWAAVNNTHIHKPDAVCHALHDGYESTVRLLLQSHPCHVLDTSAECLYAINSHPWLAPLLLHSGVLLPRQMRTSLQHDSALSTLLCEPLSLHNWCRVQIRRHLGLRCLCAIPELPIPVRLRQFLLFQVPDNEQCGVNSDNVEETITPSSRRPVARNPFFYYGHARNTAPYPGYTS